MFVWTMSDAVSVVFLAIAALIAAVTVVGYYVGRGVDAVKRAFKR
jgi:hypothetical protein